MAANNLIPVPPGDRWRLLALVLLALCLRGYTVANTTVPSRDCIVFVRDGLQLESPPPEYESRLAVLRKLEHHPGYPVAIVVMSWPVRSIMGETTVASMSLSAQLVSALAAVLLVFPMFFLARRVFDRNIAYAASAIFTVLPVYVDVSSDGISDSLFLLTVAWALWFAAQAMDASNWKRAFLFGSGSGACCGIGYLLRIEVGVVALGIGLTLAGTLLNRLARRGPSRQPLFAGIGLVLGFCVFFGPYVQAIGKLTNKPTAGALIEGALKGEAPKKTYFERDESRLRGVNLPIAAWWNDKAFEGQSKPVWALKALWAEYSKAAHYVVPFFGLIGLLISLRRLSDPRLMMLVLTSVFHLCVLYTLVLRNDYVSQRHTLLTVMITTIFVAVALPAIGSFSLRLWHRPSATSQLAVWMKQRTPWQVGAFLTLAILAVAITRDLRSLHHERSAHKEAGLWLKEHGDPSIPIIDPFGWTEWYAGRTLDRWPDPHQPLTVPLYVIFEPYSDSAHSRLAKYEIAQGLHDKPGSVALVEYTPNGKPKKRVVVYLFTPEPKKKGK